MSTAPITITLSANVAAELAYALYGAGASTTSPAAAPALAPILDAFPGAVVGGNRRPVQSFLDLLRSKGRNEPEKSLARWLEGGTRDARIQRTYDQVSDAELETIYAKIAAWTPKG